MLEYKEYLLKESTMKGLTIKSNRIKWFLISVNQSHPTHIITHPGLVFKKIGLFTFFNDPIELKEFTPIPPNVNTGILKSVSAAGSILDAVYWIYFFYSSFFCSYIKIYSISSNFFAISSWCGSLLGFLLAIVWFLSYFADSN